MDSATVSARFNAEIIAKIDSLVTNGDFGSRGEFVQYAVRKILMSYESRSPPPPIKAGQGKNNPGVAAG